MGEVVFIWRNEWRRHRLVIEAFPVEVLQPRLSFYFIHSEVAESFDAFPHDKFVNEVSSLKRPSCRDVLLSNLNLFLQNLVSDLLPSLPHVGSFTHHALIGDDSECVIVYSECMVLFAKHFRGHVAWSSARLLGVLIFEIPSDAEICNS